MGMVTEAESWVPGMTTSYCKEAEWMSETGVHQICIAIAILLQLTRNFLLGDAARSLAIQSRLSWAQLQRGLGDVRWMRARSRGFAEGQRGNMGGMISPFVEETSELEAVDGQGGAEALLAVVDLHRAIVMAGSVDVYVCGVVPPRRFFPDGGRSSAASRGGVGGVDGGGWCSVRDVDGRGSELWLLRWMATCH